VLSYDVMNEQKLDKVSKTTHRVPTLYEELNSLTFPDHARIFSLTKLTCNSYFSLHFSRLLLLYTDSLCYHYHILNH